ncbi:MAG: CPBP family glutamic-type intramembrane protease [Anaerolineaceae bacterium]
METVGEGRVKLDWKTTVLTVVSTLLILVGYYRDFTPWKFLDRFILFLIIPLGVIWLVYRERASEYGFRLGNWRLGLMITLGACLVFSLLIWLALRLDAGFKNYYQGVFTGAVIGPAFLDLIGWEFLFRGWLLFGYARKFGEHALWLQAVPFALAHIGKPQIETLTTIFGGFAFGWLSLKTGSFLYAFLIHWYILTFTVLASRGMQF